MRIKTKKAFIEPACEIVRISIEDIVSTSGDNWYVGEEEI